MILIRSMLLITAFVSSTLFASDPDNHEHTLGDIKGKDIELKFNDHAVAGSIKDHIVFGYMLKGKFGSQLEIRMGHDVITSQFTKTEKGISGVIKSTDEDGKEKTTTVDFDHIDKDNQKIFMKVNGNLVEVTVDPEKVDNHHFINPKYSMTVGGEDISFKIEDGMACYGCSVNLLFMILGAYVHL